MRRGDTSKRDEEFSAFVRSRGDHHLRTAILLTGDRQSGEDLLQASLLKLYRAWPRIDVSTSPDAYLRRIIVNTRRSWWQARWRREGPAEIMPGDAEPASPGLGSAGMEEDFADRHVLGLLVRQSLAKLPRQQRLVLVLRYCEDMSEADVAALLGCSAGTVKTHAHRGMRAMRVKLGDLGLFQVNEATGPAGGNG